MKTPPKIIRTGKFINCKICEKPFYIKKYQFNIAKYCSRKCQGLAATSKVTINCHVCGKKFSHISCRSNKAKYCSNKCRYESNKNRGKTEYTCRHCNKKFVDSKSTKRKYCSRKCINKHDQSIWKGNFTTVRRNMITRGMIKKCSQCGYDKEPKILGVHHIDHDRNNNSQVNLAILCPNCHSLAHMKHISHGSN